MKEIKDIFIRKVKPEDAEQFVLLENFIYRNTYKDILPEDVILKKEEQTSTRIQEFSKTHYNDNENICYVAEPMAN